MDLNRVLLKELAKNSKDGKVSSKYNPELAMKYLKWLSYTPEFENKYIIDLTNKRAVDLSSDELNKLKKYKKQQEMINVFKRYLSDECKPEDILPVYDYIKSTPLNSLMNSKLTSEERTEANKLIKETAKLPLIDLCNLIKGKKENYSSLSMIEAYAIHKLDDIANAKSSAKLHREISAQIKLKRYEYD